MSIRYVLTCFVYANDDLSFTVEDLPKVTCDRVSIVSTPDKKGVLAIMNGHDIYELKIENGKFVWKEYPMKTKIRRRCCVAIQM